MAGGGVIAGTIGGSALHRITTDNTTNQVSVTILSLPADNDQRSSEIAREFEKNLRAVGINASIEPRSEAELLRAILLEHDFDCYVTRRRSDHDPDFLYEMFHSSYDPEAGWQNPFGFTNPQVDELLEQQRSMDGDERTETVNELLNKLAQTHPIVPICVSAERRVVRTDRFDGWDDHSLESRLGYLGLEPNAYEWSDGEDVVLTAILTDTRATKNLNPLTATHHDKGTFVDLLYDSLAVEDDGEIRPWLAESWEWDGAVATVYLRTGCQFHDDHPVTARDVEFTYEFLADTSLGEQDAHSPTPRYRGLVDAVERVSAVDDHTVQIRIDAHADIGERAFTIPILPRHVWEPEVSNRLENGQEPTQGTWEIVTADSIPKIGSGPYAFVNQEPRSSLQFERFDQHFTRRESVDLPEPTPDELVFLVGLNSGLVMSELQDGNADMTASRMAVGEIGDTSDRSLELIEPATPRFYHVGFNVRNAPFSSPNFREVIASLIDRESLVSEIFNGQATPTVTPVTDEWTPEDLEWDGEAPYAPFFRKSDETGDEDSGNLDVEQVKRAFERYGFQYSDDGERLVR
ncbi:hypothetical protein HALLA_20005 (plasmid) [Halostagnicola larsenii XH-48]|uniref:Solute-binding protein family 5 domain-containing protein n=1 Tax=Halostagnicola larsenii XH-48 TaxID=797299 RepID=W0JUB6_9EURY|nr:hypothetical protein HALLA_20005 [Halostagnicola larsenii XH-48]